MKMLPDQFDNYLIETSQLYENYTRAVFPISAKKCETFFGNFTQIFHKCETAFNSGVFYLHKCEMTFKGGEASSWDYVQKLKKHLKHFFTKLQLLMIYRF